VRDMPKNQSQWCNDSKWPTDKKWNKKPRA
jgi:hypothetical protein